MHVSIVHIWVKPEWIDAFIEAARLNHESSVQEPGNRRFDVLQEVGDPAKFVLYEAYSSAEEAVAHKQTAHYQAWRETVKDMMSQPRQGIVHKGLYPA